MDEFVVRLAAVGDEIVVPIGVLAAPDGRLLYANRTFVELVGARDPVGLVAASLFDDETFEGLLAEVTSSGGPIRADLALSRGAGADEARIVRLAMRRVDGLDDPGALIVTLRDVSADRRIADQLRALARFPDMNPGPVLRFDERGHIVLANRAAREVFATDELVGRSWTDICPGMDAARWGEVLQTGSASVEASIEERSFVFAHVVDAEMGTVFAFGSDVTSIREADRLLEAQARQLAEFARLPDMNPGPVLKLEVDTTILLSNRAARDLFGSDVVDRRWSEVCPDFDPSEWKAVLGSLDFVAVEREVGRRAFIFYHRRDGESGRVFVYGADVTEQRRAQEELAEAKLAAEDASQAKSQFLANMSHELRTPMNAIIGYSEMLIEDAELEGDEEAVADLAKIHSAGRHLLDLINDVLDLSKIEAGGMDVHVEVFPIADLVGEVATVTQPLVEKKANRLEIELSEPLGEMCSDVTKIRQCVLNLISNAAKFTEEGVVTLRADRTRGEEGDRVLLSVTDTGTGIPEDQFDHVFEEFAQASSTIARDYGGTGLGLPLTRRFCRLLGGDVRLESEVGRGSTFTIDLPADFNAPGTGGEISSGGGRTEPRPGGAPGAPERRCDVLVIDDDPRARELLVRGLERAGYSVVTAGDGATGIELARDLQPGMITLDIIMPAMDGWAVLSALKTDSATSDIPVAMVSIAPDNDLGLILGAVESLQKPVDRDVLHALAGRYVAGAGAVVLIVDDDDASRSVTRRHGEAAGWRCLEAENGAVALDLIAGQRPDLILLDLMMPVMDGFEMLDELRARPEHRSIPVLVLTAKNLSDEDRARLDGDVERVLEKGRHGVQDVVAYVGRTLAADDGSPAPG